jgi:hypothetical protein
MCFPSAVASDKHIPSLGIFDSLMLLLLENLGFQAHPEIQSSLHQKTIVE